MQSRPPWLSRPETIRRLWQGFAVVLALTVLAELRVSHEGHFAVERLFGFNAAYGFLACAVLILIAKAIGIVLKRPEAYYDDAPGTPRDTHYDVTHASRRDTHYDVTHASRRDTHYDVTHASRRDDSA